MSSSSSVRDIPRPVPPIGAPAGQRSLDQTSPVSPSEEGPPGPGNGVVAQDLGGLPPVKADGDNRSLGIETEQKQDLGDKAKEIQNFLNDRQVSERKASDSVDLTGRKDADKGAEDALKPAT